MDSETSTSFKAEVRPWLESAIERNGGIERVRKIYGLMSGATDFIAGWTAGMVTRERRLTGRSDLSHEEIRRIYDLVRLRIDSESSTS